MISSREAPVDFFESLEACDTKPEPVGWLTPLLPRGSAELLVSVEPDDEKVGCCGSSEPSSRATRVC